MDSSTNLNEGQATAVDALRGGAIGVVSGIKGGALSGALAGILLALSASLISGDWMVILFAILVGATYGGMGMAVVGAVLGSISGTLSGFILVRQNDTQFVPAVWWGTGLLTGLVAGWFFITPFSWLAILLGGVCGLLGGWASGRDFLNVVLSQEEQTTENQ
ncbi:MAG: hypothetical protein KDD89_03110 [Anaerolineales bacterium]|nr:hypothetical protein [Anaerolineales bacterium]